MTDTELNKAVYRRWLEECWSGDDSDLQGDIDLQDRLLGVDVVDHNPVPGVPTGLDGQRAVLGIIAPLLRSRRSSTCCLPMVTRSLAAGRRSSLTRATSWASLQRASRRRLPG
jgi:hypothetical protein